MGALIISANQLREEIKKTLNTCYDSSFQGIEGHYTLALAHQVDVRQPKLEAWGFFNLDNSTFVLVICAVLNYLIVLCQAIINQSNTN